MRVHHLNCGTMRPLATPEGVVCHVLLLETDHGLTLVDSGLGLRDIADPAKRFGRARFFVRPAFDEAETAIRQVADEAVVVIARSTQEAIVVNLAELYALPPTEA